MKKISTILLFLSLSNVSLSQELSSIKSDDLMKSFWQCHKISEETEGKGSRFPENLVPACSAVSTEVQRRFFDNDFAKMHEWTRINRKQSPLVVK